MKMMCDRCGGDAAWWGIFSCPRERRCPVTGGHVQCDDCERRHGETCPRGYIDPEAREGSSASGQRR